MPLETVSENPPLLLTLKTKFRDGVRKFPSIIKTRDCDFFPCASVEANKAAVVVFPVPE
jgi:hypothetical protein